MFALLLTHQLWPTLLGQNHMVALLLTHQLLPTLLGQNLMVALLLTHQLCISCADICSGNMCFCFHRRIAGQIPVVLLEEVFAWPLAARLLLCNVFSLISGGMVACSRVRPWGRVDATFPPDIKGNMLV